MCRVLDVAKIGGMHVNPGSFSAQITDPLCPWNEGVWQFETMDGLLHVRPSQKPDCVLSIHGLAALAYGTHAPSDFAIRGWGDPPADVQAAMQTMFPPMQPHLHERF